jgi:hypothetical protein
MDAVGRLRDRQLHRQEAYDPTNVRAYLGKTGYLR